MKRNSIPQNSQYNKEKFKNITISLILAVIAFELWCIRNGVLRTKTDKLFIRACLFMQIFTLLGILLKLPHLVFLSHAAFAGCMFLLPFFTNNKYILGLILVLMVLRAITRYATGVCLFSVYEDYEINYSKYVNWDYVYGGMIMFIAYKLIT